MKDTPANKAIFEFLQNELQGHFLVDEPLSRHTWYRIGGPADFVVYPKDESTLTELGLLCTELGVDIYVIGKGANVLVNDKGLRGVIFNLEKHFRGINRESNALRVGAGVTLEELILWCERNQLGGLEGLSGIPGTLGGALFMNAGAGQNKIGDVVTQVKVLNEQLQPKVMQPGEIRFDYRAAPGLQGKIIVDCRMNLRLEHEQVLRNARLTRIRERAAKHPLEFPSCGSIFKRPKEGYASLLIEKAGLKGLRYRNAMISDKHAGFIVNLGGAKAEEVMYLVRVAQDRVSELFDITLETEVQLLGFPRK